MKKTYSAEIAKTIDRFLKEDGWSFSFDEKYGLFKFELHLIKSKIKEINYIIAVKEHEYIVHAIAPIGADNEDKKMMSAMAEFICRVNYGLKNGSFQLDMEDGEVQYKVFVDCEGIIPSKEIVQNSILCPAAMFEHYGSRIADIIFGNFTSPPPAEQWEEEAEVDLDFIPREFFEDDEDTDTDCFPLMLKPDLFDTQGGDD